MGQEFSGRLRERITIERQRAGRDALGAALALFDGVGTFWATAEALGSGDPAAAGSRSALPRWSFTLRETEAIQPGDRLLWNGKVLTVFRVLLEHRLIPRTILQAEEKR